MQIAKIKGIKLDEVLLRPPAKDTQEEEKEALGSINPCQDIVELSREFPMFSEEMERLREDLRHSEINDTSLRYVVCLHLYAFPNPIPHSLEKLPQDPHRQQW